MEKKDLISFKLESAYIDFLESFKREFIISLTQSGAVKIKELDIKTEFYTLDKRCKKFAHIDSSDDIILKLKNRESLVTLFFHPLSAATSLGCHLYTSREDQEECMPTYYCDKVTCAEVFEQKELLEAITLWLKEGQLTPWIKKRFKKLRVNK